MPLSKSAFLSCALDGELLQAELRCSRCVLPSLIFYKLCQFTAAALFHWTTSVSRSPTNEVLAIFTSVQPLNLIVFLNFHIDLPLLPTFLATLLASNTWASLDILALSDLRLLRCSFGLLARSGLVNATRRCSGTGGDLGAFERVPASAEGSAVLVAKLDGNFLGVELGEGVREFLQDCGFAVFWMRIPECLR